MTKTLTRAKMKTYRVPVTIAEERTATVKGHSPEHASKRLREGKYVTLGRPGLRGFLTVGKPEEQR